MRYLVKARVKPNQETPLREAIEAKTLGEGSVAGSEYLRNMAAARWINHDYATWVEVCYCASPLEEERPYWEEYFDFISVTDAHSRRNCRHENGTESWACSDCDCTARLDQRMQNKGQSFLDLLSQGKQSK